MTVSTQGLQIDSGSRVMRDVAELLSSMRFAISLLTVICIASVIGTVVKQHEPINNYVNQFGPFWAEVFGRLSLYAVYSAWWFLLILAFLVLSTSLCIIRNTPKILADLKAYKENIREQSLKAFHHRAAASLTEAPEAAARRIGQTLAGGGWKVRLQQREHGWMVAAKAGAANKIGYLAAHSAIVLVCVGGLLDGDLIVRAQMWFNGKTPYEGGGLIADVPAQHRLPAANPTFRANLLVTEGTQSSTAILTQPKGVLLQDLPFSVELKKFVVEYYSTGMPKLFASDIVIHDKDSGEKTEARVEVNHPVSHRGIQIYQSSFDDGGSRVKLRALPMAAAAQGFDVEGAIGGSTEISNGDKRLTLEFTGLRVINVENMNNTSGAMASGADVRSVDLRHAIEGRLGAANKTATKKELRNIGPSVSYKLRDEAGQATEFNNYMLPVDVDGGRVFLFGLRETPAEPFRYLRVPADDRDGVDGFVRLRAALADGTMRNRAVARYVAQAVDRGNPQLMAALQASASRALDLFAGVDPALESLKPAGQTAPIGGLQAVSRFMEQSVPEAERERASEVLVRILNGTLFELLQASRQSAGLPLLDPQTPATQAFMTQAVLSLSDAFFYPAPMSFQLADFTQLQASVFQVARAPGKTIVYLGCLLLILGVFAMLYIRERRLWVWLAPAADAPATGTQATMALSTNRKTMDGDREFDLLKSRLIQAHP
ncbi:cytochrome c biogenesis protein ResB [Hydrogenophaga sp. OTU3427]|uniref:cytochrome c biogenesis protein ResB n=1 Tax=Hydrogenophaga sp. OTU3427 TaxID=3043856 RepID=UPI00313C1569